MNCLMMFLLFLFTLMLDGIAATLLFQTTPTYDATTIFSNPSRGFYHHYGTLCRENGTECSDYRPLSAALLTTRREREAISLGYRVFFLQNYRCNIPFTSSMLKRIESDLEEARRALVKLAVRFAYTNGEGQYPVTFPWGDCDLDSVLLHIGQLKPIIQRYKDVLLAFEAGFIGIWGEWWFTTYFSNGTKPYIIEEEHWQKRVQVIRALLDAVPEPIQVLIRYPRYKLRMNLTSEERQRIGFHNDCFLATITDMGTYSNDPTLRLEERAYLANETKTQAIGGETCGVNRPRSQCATALSELETFHWTFLNNDYHQSVIAEFESGGCKDEIKRRLGYRLAVKSLELVRDEQTRRIYVNVSVENTGFAAPLLRYQVELSFSSEQRTLVADLSDIIDTRVMLPGVVYQFSMMPVEFSPPAPAPLAAASYLLSLRFIDPLNSNYTIRLAHVIDNDNHISYDNETGSNLLGMVVMALEATTTTTMTTMTTMTTTIGDEQPATTAFISTTDVASSSAANANKEDSSQNLVNRFGLVVVVAAGCLLLLCFSFLLCCIVARRRNRLRSGGSNRSSRRSSSSSLHVPRGSRRSSSIVVGRRSRQNTLPTRVLF